MYPIPSMGLVYLPTCTIRISQMMPNVGKYTSPMDGMGVSFFYNKYFGCVFFGYFVRIGIPGDSSPYRFFSGASEAKIQDISRKFFWQKQMRFLEKVWQLGTQMTLGLASVLVEVSGLGGWVVGGQPIASSHECWAPKKVAEVSGNLRKFQGNL